MALVRKPQGQDKKLSFIRVRRVYIVGSSKKSELRAVVWEVVGGWWLKALKVDGWSLSLEIV